MSFFRKLRYWIWPSSERIGFFVTACDYKDNREAPDKEGYLWAIKLEFPERRVASGMQNMLYEKINETLEKLDKGCQKDWVNGEVYIRATYVFEERQEAERELKHIRSLVRELLKDVLVNPPDTF